MRGLLMSLSPGILSFLCLAVAPSMPGEQQRGMCPVKSAGIRQAVCVLMPVGDSKVRGVVHFVQHGDVVKVSGKVTGLTPGKHGFHVHQFGDLTSLEDGKSAGGHYNPTNKPHGRPSDRQRHVGDLGNIVADSNGTAMIDIQDSVIKLGGPHSILGRGLVVHAGADKFTQPTGDAGARVALGVIGVAQENKTDD